MKELVYLSTALNLMTDDELKAILGIARKNNTINNVTGILLYAEGTFIQVLEGSRADVDKLFNHIEKDKRHKGIIKLLDRNIEQRNFPDWSMGFSPISRTKVEEITGLIRSTSDILGNKNSGSSLTILKTFINSNNLVINH
ncbi:BLUF domain-containing protein [Mucilaginibacter sp.]|uniref:BLUF domain-containing protein n=1 Tax=Mucilaginibacter sp. TaxID=1882438 RepID=UPI003D0D7DA9